MNKKILTINTSDKDTQLILQDGGAVIDCLVVKSDNKHAELLIVNIEELLTRNGVWYSDIHCFSVVNGPGSFIGTRVSMAVIKAIKIIMKDINIIINNVFEILSFGKEYDIIVLGATMNSYYICDKFNNMSYKKSEEILSIVGNEKKIISNCKNLMDFLKIDNIFYTDVNMNEMVLLNMYKYDNNIINNKPIEPLYIREAQVNRKKSD
jgi:tRNA A37 threonylcarbamoyladenosine modification protein TsaB